MSVAQAPNFTGRSAKSLRTRLKDVVASRARAALEKEFAFKIPPAEEKQLGEILGPISATTSSTTLSNSCPAALPANAIPPQLNQPGTEKCIALVYEGVEAIRKIRDVLGPTDPSKAPPGSIRREFGQNIMVNAAHASDSEENAAREMDIVNVGENNLRAVVEEFYGKL